MSDILKKYGVSTSQSPKSSVLEKYGVVLNKSEKPTEQNISEIESGLRGAGQGLTFGLSDEAIAGIKALANPLDYSNEYSKLVELERAKNKAAQEANPGSYMAGEIGGGVGSAFIPGVGAAKGATALARIGRALGQGALSGYGYGEGKDTTSKIKDIGTGAGFGLAGGVVGETVLPLASKASRSIAEKLGVIHLRPDPSTSRYLGKEGLKSASGAAIDSGDIKFLRKIDTTLEGLKGSSKKAGEELEGVIAKSGAKVDPRVISQRIESEVVNPLSENIASEPLAERIKRGFLKRFDKRFNPDVGPPALLSHPEAESQKRAVAALVDRRPGGAPKPANEANEAIARIFKEESENAAEKLGVQGFKEAKKKAGDLINARKMADKTASLLGGGFKQYLGDLGIYGTLGSAALATNDPETKRNAAYLALLRALTKGRIASTGAVSANQLLKLLQSSGARAVVERALPQSTYDYLRRTNE